VREKNRSYVLILHKENNGIKLGKECGRNERIVRKGYAGTWR
jgi:hypothetical protein